MRKSIRRGVHTSSYFIDIITERATNSHYFVSLIRLCQAAVAWILHPRSSPALRVNASFAEWWWYEGGDNLDVAVDVVVAVHVVQPLEDIPQDDGDHSLWQPLLTPSPNHHKVRRSYVAQYVPQSRDEASKQASYQTCGSATGRTAVRCEVQ